MLLLFMHVFSFEVLHALLLQEELPWMGWSDEVHARRLLDFREFRKKQKAAGRYGVSEIKGNSSNLPIALLVGEPWYSCVGQYCRIFSS